MDLTDAQLDRLKIATTRDLTRKDRGWGGEAVVINNLVDMGLLEPVCLSDEETVWRITRMGWLALSDAVT